MDSYRKVYSVLMGLFGILVIQAVYGTTVVPLCKSEESIDNCTTAMVQTSESPRVASVKITRCQMEMEHFCWNGQCMYLVELDEHYCRCEKGYSGIRCAHAELVIQPVNQEYLAVTIFLSFLLLLAIAVSSFFAYKWYRSKHIGQPSNEYKEVNTLNL
ncbi:hypothetical protein GDO86_000752 [Hymenochirus boettgeri]|uniref:Proepiregulin n=1 Tax=Hymenochirus boettgeri TaxID=247094 RepID=A0A8T2KC37_9PIPI|nr:hypothetical protein GDO86_000752 [Hymenochirus boettgeri]